MSTNFFRYRPKYVPNFIIGYIYQENYGDEDSNKRIWKGVLSNTFTGMDNCFDKNSQRFSKREWIGIAILGCRYSVVNFASKKEYNVEGRNNILSLKSFFSVISIPFRFPVQLCLIGLNLIEQGFLVGAKACDDYIEKKEKETTLSKSDKVKMFIAFLGLIFGFVVCALARFLRLLVRSLIDPRAGHEAAKRIKVYNPGFGNFLIAANALVGITGAAVMAFFGIGLVLTGIGIGVGTPLFAAAWETITTFSSVVACILGAGMTSQALYSTVGVIDQVVPNMPARHKTKNCCQPITFEAVEEDFVVEVNYGYDDGLEKKVTDSNGCCRWFCSIFSRHRRKRDNYLPQLSSPN